MILTRMTFSPSQLSSLEIMSVTSTFDHLSLSFWESDERFAITALTYMEFLLGRRISLCQDLSYTASNEHVVGMRQVYVCTTVGAYLQPGFHPRGVSKAGGLSNSSREQESRDPLDIIKKDHWTATGNQDIWICTWFSAYTIVCHLKKARHTPICREGRNLSWLRTIYYHCCKSLYTIWIYIQYSTKSATCDNRLESNTY